MIKKTFQELVELDAIVASMFRRNANLAESKFGYGYKKFYRLNLKTPLEKYQEELNDIAIDNAMEDQTTKALVKTADGNSFEYSKEGWKALKKAERAVKTKWYDTELEVEPFIIAKENLPELSDEQKEVFANILIK